MRELPDDSLDVEEEVVWSEEDAAYVDYNSLYRIWFLEFLGFFLCFHLLGIPTCTFTGEMRGECVV